MEGGGCGRGGAENTGMVVLIVTGGAMLLHGALMCLMGTYGAAHAAGNFCSRGSAEQSFPRTGEFLLRRTVLGQIKGRIFDVGTG